MVNFKDKPFEVVVNETAEPIGPIGWDGKTYIWDPHPGTVKSGEKAKHFIEQAQPGRVSRGFGIMAGQRVPMNDCNGIIGPEKLVEAPGVPVYRHTCPPDFVHELRYGKHAAVGRKLTFAAALVDEHMRNAEVAIQARTQAEALVEQKKVELAELNAKIAEAQSHSKKLEAFTLNISPRLGDKPQAEPKK